MTKFIADSNGEIITPKKNNPIKANIVNDTITDSLRLIKQLITAPKQDGIL